MDARRAAILEAMGIDRFVARAPLVEPLSSPSPSVQSAAPVVALAAPTGVDELHVGSLDWDALAGQVATCTRCALAAGRSQSVFGGGDRAARWMIVGEGPGAEEDRAGEPFLGSAGQLLDSMLQAIGLRRPQVYLANILKCRAPGNRDPHPAEARCCMPFLQRQIELVDPALILCLGRIAAHSLLGVETPLGQLRGRVHELNPLGRKVVVTYHPGYLLRTPGEKRKVWADLQLAMETARGQRA
ncbi:MAG: uracil-DNA glycosylase [Pseudomonadota bacterium]